MVTKVVVLGLDGFNPDLVYQWRNDLPSLSSMMSKGIFGKIESTVPPITPQAWTCAQTGKNPGQFGFWDFRYRDEFSYGEARLVNSKKAAAADPLYRILPRYGKRVGMINVPVTYPPPTIPNGYCVSSFMTPNTEVDFTYPKELKEEITRLFGEYILDASTPDMNYRRMDKEAVLKRIYDMDRQKFDILKHFIKGKSCDYIFTVIMGTDRMPHLFYRYFDERHIRYEANPHYKDALKGHYKFCDENIGEILQLLHGETVFIVLSDHSVQRLDGRINLNEWLRREGYLVLGARPTEPVVLGNAAVDWSKTKAWATGYTGQIYLNVEGREPQGVVTQGEYDFLLNELSERLLAIPDEKGNKLDTKVFKRDDIHFGDFAQFGPDLFIYFDNCHWNIDEALGFDSIYSYDTSLGPDDGAHGPQGFFAMTGPGVPRMGELFDITLVDIAPTVCHLMEVPIPPDMEGRVLTEEESTEIYSEKGAEDVRQRLRGLGYFRK